jgi:hypothetical protein
LKGQDKTRISVQDGSGKDSTGELIELKERIAMLRKAIDMTVVYKGQGREMWESGYDGSGHDSSRAANRGKG